MYVLVCVLLLFVCVVVVCCVSFFPICMVLVCIVVFVVSFVFGMLCFCFLDALCCCLRSCEALWVSLRFSVSPSGCSMFSLARCVYLFLRCTRRLQEATIGVKLMT